MQTLLETVFSVCLLAAFITESTAQPLRFGAETGIGYSLLDYDKTPDFWRPDGRVSYNTMLFVLFDLPALFALQAGLRYSRYGNKVTVRYPGDIEGPAGFFRVKLSYVSVPLRLQMRARGQGFYAFVGPEIGYLVDASAYQKLFNGQESTEDVIDTVERLNISLGAGIGHWVSLGRQDLSIQFVFTRGFSRIAKPDQWQADWNTQDFAITMGLVL